MGKRFGQHFLCDAGVIDTICQVSLAMRPEGDGKTIVEIGPGEGVLTKELIDFGGPYIACEVDTTLEKKLDKIFTIDRKNAHLVRWDVLQLPRKQEDNCLSLSTPDYSFSVPFAELVVVGNLPYYITSPLMRLFFGHPWPVWGVVMIQKEVADKLVTSAKKKSYLRWLINNFYTVERVCQVDPQSFSPPPAVWSSVITLAKRNKPFLVDKDWDTFLILLDQINAFPRKMLRAIWKKIWLTIPLPPVLAEKRLEELSWEEIATLVQQ